MQQQNQTQNNSSTNENLSNPSNSNTQMNILFLSDLIPTISEEDLQNFFKFYSEKIKHISVNHKTKKSANATVIFEDQKIAEIAKKNLNMQKIKGKTVRIMWHMKEKEIFENPNNNIYVKNISNFATPRQVYEYFSKFGEIISCKIPENDQGEHLGYGYINYTNTESAKNAIDSENGKLMWNNLIEVMPFKNSKIRLEENFTPYIPQNPLNFQQGAQGQYPNTFPSGNFGYFNATNNPHASSARDPRDINCTIYIHNFPTNYVEENFFEIFAKNNLEKNEVKTCKVIKNPNAPYAILVFHDLTTTEKFKEVLSKIELDGNFLRVENYKKSGYNAQGDNTANPSNSKGPSGNNNLIVKNIPYDAEESDLTNSFEKFGNIKSVKIERVNLITKVNEEYVEKRTSQGFGYICFEKNEEALNAKENMDGKYLPKFEMWKRPLVIDFFIPKGQRRNYQNANNPNNPNNAMNPMGFNYGNYPQANNPNQNEAFRVPQNPGVNNFDMQNFNKELDGIKISNPLENNNSKFNNNNSNKFGGQMHPYLMDGQGPNGNNMNMGQNPSQQGKVMFNNMPPQNQYNPQMNNLQQGNFGGNPPQMNMGQMNPPYGYMGNPNNNNNMRGPNNYHSKFFLFFIILQFLTKFFCLRALRFIPF